MDKSQAVEHIDMPAHKASSDNDGRLDGMAEDNIAEHDLTIRDVFKNHKMLLWWSFYFAMCAVGWYGSTGSFHVLIC
jgi:hypothetical protein